MRIAVDVSAVRLPGPRVYCAGFLPALAGLLNAGDELTVFGPDDIEGIVCPLVGPRIRFVGNPMLKRVPARIWWQQFTLPGLLKSIRADVLFEPFDMGPWHGHCPMVVGIRNPNPVILDGGVVAMTRQERMFGRVHKFLVSNACRRAKLLIFPSRYAAQAVGGRLPGNPAIRRVVHHGLDTEFWSEPESRPEAGADKYILFASKFYEHKRAPLLLEAFALWRQRRGRDEYRLVYCGEESGSGATENVRRRAQELGLSGSVELRGIVSRDELRSLYRGASQVVLPTVMETFGFPYIEAMALGKPLVCADIEVARELCGDAPYYFRPDDAGSLAEALEFATESGPAHAEKLAMGRDLAGKFSWRREAEETLACLREVAG